MSKKQMTVAELKEKLEGLSSPFFSRNNMRHSGDTLGNYGIRSKPVSLQCLAGDVALVWELYRRRPVKHGLQAPAFFCTNTFQQRHGEVTI